MSGIKLYPEMNEKICDLLRGTGEPMNLYAATLIDQLRERVRELGAELKSSDDEIPAGEIRSCATCADSGYKPVSPFDEERMKYGKAIPCPDCRNFAIEGC